MAFGLSHELPLWIRNYGSYGIPVATWQAGAWRGALDGTFRGCDPITAHTYIYIYICTWQNSKMIKYIWTKNCWVLQSTVHIHNIPKIFTPHKDVYKWTHLWLWALTSGALVALDRSWVFSQAANGRGFHRTRNGCRAETVESLIRRCKDNGQWQPCANMFFHCQGWVKSKEVVWSSWCQGKLFCWMHRCLSPLEE